MKNYHTLIILLIFTLSCSKQQEIVPVSTKNIVKKTRATKPKCDRDYVVHPHFEPKKSKVQCPLGGNLCYRDKKGGLHGCGEYADPKGILATYTNVDGSINSQEYVTNEDYMIMFPDITSSMYQQIVSGSLHLYLVPWTDATQDNMEEETDCPTSIYVLSSSTSINDVNNSNISLIWIY